MDTRDLFAARSVERILSARRTKRLRYTGQLRALGIVAERAAPYILLDGSRPPIQPPLPLAAGA